MDTRTDDQLFEDFRVRGDTAALAALFDRAAKDLLRVAVHLTGDLADAEDLVQETFLAAIRGARRYRSDGRIRAWLAGILQNQARRLRRRRGRPVKVLDVELPDSRPVDGFDAATAAERRALARDALERIPEPYRTVLGLRYAHGFSVQEIAAALERPANTVQSQLQRGTERLRRMLPGEGGLAALAAVSTEGLCTVRAEVLAAASGGGVAAAGVTAITVRATAFLLAALLAFGVGVPWMVGRLAGVELAGVETAPLATPPAADAPIDASDPQDEPLDRGPVERAALPPPVGARLVALRVIETGTMRPVPGARVTAYDAASQARIDALAPDAWRSAQRQRANDLEAHQLRFGTVHLADARGVVHLPEHEAWGPMTARSGRLYGERHGDETDCIVVAPDRELRVRVVDHAGRPAAGITLGLGDGARGAHFLPGGRPWILACTDEDGVAAFPHAQVAALDLGARRGREEMCVVALAPGLLLLPDPVHRIPLGGALPSTLDARLSPAGTAEVRVLDARGDPVHDLVGDRLDVFVHVAGSGGRFDGEIGDDGVARFAHLPVGRRLRFTAGVDGGASTWVEHAGVRRHGERIALEIPFGSDATTVFGRAVDARGRPLGGVPLLARGVAEFAPSGARIDTGADGAFRLVVHPEEGVGSVDVALHRVALRRRGPIELDDRLLGPTATLRDVPLAAGAVHDVGDVTFAEPARLGSGSWRAVPPQLAHKVPWLEPTVEHRAGPESDWSPLADAFVAWHDDGTFAVHGAPVSGTIRVRGRSVLAGFVSSVLALAPLEFAPGAHDLHVDAVASGELGLDFVGPPDVLRFDLVPAEGVWPAHDHRQLLDRPADTSLIVVGGGPERSAPLVGSLWPGRYRVTVRLAGIDEALLVLDDLLVPAGTRVRPLFDRPLDVRDRFDVVDVAFVAEDGKRVARGTVWLRPFGAETIELGFDDGRLQRGLRRGGFEAVATSSGRGFAVFDGEADGQQVAIPPRRRVSFVLESAAAPDRTIEPPAGVQIRIDVEPAVDHPLRRFANVDAIGSQLRPRPTDDTFRFVSRADGPHVARAVALRDGVSTAVGEVRFEIDAGTEEVALVVDDAALR